VSEIKGEVSRLDVHSPCGDEDRFEPDSLGTDVSVRGRLATFTYGADSLQIRSGKTILITLNHDVIRMNLERDERRGILLVSLFEFVILGILKKLKDKSCATSVDVFC
jgi:hypothetical protein